MSHPPWRLTYILALVGRQRSAQAAALFLMPPMMAVRSASGAATDQLRDDNADVKISGYQARER